MLRGDWRACAWVIGMACQNGEKHPHTQAHASRQSGSLTHVYSICLRRDNYPRGTGCSLTAVSHSLYFNHDKATWTLTLSEGFLSLWLSLEFSRWNFKKVWQVKRQVAFVSLSKHSACGVDTAVSWVQLHQCLKASVLLQFLLLLPWGSPSEELFCSGAEIDSTKLRPSGTLHMNKQTFCS